MSSPYFSTTVRNFLIAIFCFSITAVAVAGYMYQKTEDTLTGFINAKTDVCPSGEILVGKISTACIKSGVVHEQNIRTSYELGEIAIKHLKNARVAIVFRTRLNFVEMNQVISKIDGVCSIATIKDPVGGTYGSFALPQPISCEYFAMQLEQEVRDAIERGNFLTPEAERSLKEKKMTIGSVVLFAPPSDLLEFWRQNNDIIRIIAFPIGVGHASLNISDMISDIP